MTKGKLLKALMLSAFVFPGLGHFSVGRRARGAVLVALVVILFAFFMCHIMFIIMVQVRVYQPMATGDLSQILQLSQTMNQDIIKTHGPLLKSYLSLLMICYFGGLLDLVGIYVFENKKPI